MSTLARIFIYTILPLIIAVVHIRFDKQIQTKGQKLETILLYLFGVAVGGNGIGSFVAHFFMSDLVAESIGWAAGSPFQLEVAFTNLVLGVLGVMAVSKRGEFRTATITAVTIFGFGATIVHLMDIAATGNLAPGNTIQNFANLLRPTLLITFTFLQRRYPLAWTEPIARWHQRVGVQVGIMTAGVGTGFGIGFALGWPVLFTVMGAILCGVFGAFLTAERPSTPQLEN